MELQVWKTEMADYPLRQVQKQQMVECILQELQVLEKRQSRGQCLHLGAMMIRSTARNKRASTRTAMMMSATTLIIKVQEGIWNQEQRMRRHCQPCQSILQNLICMHLTQSNIIQRE